MVQRDKSGSEAETGRKRRRDRYGLHTVLRSDSEGIRTLPGTEGRRVGSASGR